MNSNEERQALAVAAAALSSIIRSPVLVEGNASSRTVVLNRPSFLNAINTAMMLCSDEEALGKSEQGDEVSSVLSPKLAALNECIHFLYETKTIKRNHFVVFLETKPLTENMWSMRHYADT
ncbi:hypothetical protein LXL04_037418 [Taraxacum kok-saghyz]